MRRREFTTGVLAASVATAARAQARPHIAILHSGFPNRTALPVLLEAIGKLGYEDGRTASIEALGGEGNAERLKAQVARLAAQKPTIIVAITSPAVLALRQAGLEIPVVFAFVSDPVGMGVVESLARPGGNFTGVTYNDAALGGKRLELLIDAVPAARRVAVLWSRGLPENAGVFESVRKAGTVLGIEVISREFRGLDDLAPAFDDAARAGAQAIVFVTDNTMFGHRRQVAALALAHRLPSMHSFGAEVQDGGLMFYGASADENYKRAAALADRILKGARPGALPVEEPTKFELAINLGTAKALGLAVPPTLLALADDLIE